MNISHIHHCYGCGVCALACGMQIISIRLNENGFYEPTVTNPTKCTDCGLCVEVCAYSHDELSLKVKEIHSYAAWSKDSQIRHKCSSGGIGFEVGLALLSKGYKVCGVCYNAEKKRAEHYIAITPEELILSIGSKYIQSFTLDGFKSINRKEKYLVTGTPCQIDSFRRYIQRFKVEKNFVLLDFFCHGVPSKLMWDDYLEKVEKKIGKIAYVSWRDKQTGWHDSWDMVLRGEKTVVSSRFSQGDIFYRLFLGHFCLNQACHKDCKYKYDRSSADIRIGDLWGKTYQKDEKGVSAAIAFTTKGDEVLQQCNCLFTSLPFEVVAEGQMKKNASKAVLANVAMYMLKSGKTYTEQQWRLLLKAEAIFHLPHKVCIKLKQLMRR